MRKPEAGDVWIRNRNKEELYITEVGGNFISFVGRRIEDTYGDRVFYQYFENTFSRDDQRYTDFNEIFTYLGKAKANINDLFEVQDEN